MSVINVLDHGFVRLVDHMGNDLSVVRAARVSYNADWRTGEEEGKDERLIQYLLKNKHTSPFESVVFTFEVKAPLFVLRQWHRHRTWSYNEVSARYTELPEDYYVPKTEHVGVQSQHNKQMRDIGEVSPVADMVVDAFNRACEISFNLYKSAITNGVPRELARSILPLATYSRMFATVNLHNLLHFLRLRLHPHAQYEIQQYAFALLSLIDPIVPYTIQTFKETLEY